MCLHLCVSHSVHGGGRAWRSGVCMAGGGLRGRRDGHCSGRYASYWNAFLLFSNVYWDVDVMATGSETFSYNLQAHGR